MAFTVTTRTASAGDRTGEVYELAGDSARVEVWPFTGFNCLRWQVRTPGGEWGDVLFTAPDWESNPVPTRSGHPVLFPFPNRLGAGELTFGGKQYRLPLNDSAKANAIHGFSPRNPWRVLESGGGPDSAFVTGQFRPTVDVAGGGDLWPGDGSLTLTYRLSAGGLRVEAVVANHGPDPFPFGFGYHPYFRIPTRPDDTADAWELFSAAAVEWETDGGVPTGKRLPVPAELDFQTPRPLGATTLDHLFTDVRPAGTLFRDGLRRVAFLRAAGDPQPGSHRLRDFRASEGTVEIWTAAEFRELVLFTPVHRKAVAIEPYTCATDAAHLAEREIDGGWRELPPGGTFAAAVAYAWVPDTGGNAGPTAGG